MKILMVISQFYPIIGGAERQAQILAQKLVEKDVDVKLITGWWIFKTRRKEIIKGVPVFRNFSFWGAFGIKGLRPLGWLTYMITLSLYLILHKKKYDIIHVHQVLYPAFISVFVGKKILRKPVIAKIGCTGVTSDIVNIKKFPFGHYQIKFIINNLDCLISTNQEGIKEFKEIGYPEEKIHYIPNGVSIILPNKINGSELFYLISAVRLDHQKGIDILLKAVANVLVIEENLRLLILGKGPLELSLKKLSNSLGISKYVQFVGLVNNPENYLIKADIFILPSRAEGMSNALLEAMCIGLPCIATNIEGNRELISNNENPSISNGEFFIGERGILFNLDDINGLSEAILYSIRNKEAIKALGKNARMFIQSNYSIDLIANKYISLYQNILNGKF